MVFAHILNITQQVQHHSEEVHRGRWTASKDFCFWDTPLIELREKKLGMVNIEDEESLGYFQRVLRQSGIIDRLEEMGINEGDTVSILNFEFDYIR